jgi:hypothetical protein
LIREITGDYDGFGLDDGFENGEKAAKTNGIVGIEGRDVTVRKVTIPDGKGGTIEWRNCGIDRKWWRNVSRADKGEEK